MAFGDISPARPFDAPGWSMRAATPLSATFPLLLIGAASLGALSRPPRGVGGIRLRNPIR